MRLEKYLEDIQISGAAGVELPHVSRVAMSSQVGNALFLTLLQFHVLRQFIRSRCAQVSYLQFRLGHDVKDSWYRLKYLACAGLFES